jgi:hypothetical protein
MKLNILEATREYEAWAGKHIDLIQGDIALKHRRMAEGVFPFLRATFYRWAPLWHETCPELAETPRLLAVGDLHLENFGTWRDAEGRLAWGINDFDEAFPMPYAIDLVRLATSALLAISDQALALGGEAACAAILAGYGEAVARGKSEAFVLEEAHPGLRAMALSEERDPVRFWAKLTKFRPMKAPDSVERLLAKQIPGPKRPFRIVHRIAGLGSLGRPRFVALAECYGGMVAREAKAMLPSAYGWAVSGRSGRMFYEEIIEGAIRVPDPFLKIKKGWLLRRLAPHCTRIELGDFPQRRDDARILRAMGHETANIHFGTPAALPAIRRDLRRRGRVWLHEAARKMAQAVIKDWEAWRKLSRSPPRR